MTLIFQTYFLFYTLVPYNYFKHICSTNSKHLSHILTKASEFHCYILDQFQVVMLYFGYYTN